MQRRLFKGLVFERTRATLCQQVLAENNGGEDGSIGVRKVVKATPEGDVYRKVVETQRLKLA